MQPLQPFSLFFKNVKRLAYTRDGCNGGNGGYLTNKWREAGERERIEPVTTTHTVLHHLQYLQHRHLRASCARLIKGESWQIHRNIRRP